MGIITEFIEVTGVWSTIKVEALIDTGAEGNYINEILAEKFEKLGIVRFYDTEVSIAGSREKELKTSLVFKELQLLGIKFAEPEFIIFDGIDYDAVIGVEILQILGLNIDMRLDKLSL